MHNSGNGAAPQVAEAAAGGQSDRAEAGPAGDDSASSTIDPQELREFANAPIRRPQTAVRTPARLRSPHSWSRHPVQLARAEPSVERRHVAVSTARTRPAAHYDYSHMDGRSASTSGDNSDYVLTPVSAVSDSDAAAHYVMGSVVMSGRSSDDEVAHGW